MPDARDSAPAPPGPAARPYPDHLASPAVLRDGTRVLLRPIRPADEPLLVRFHAALSDRSVYHRYFRPIPLARRTSHERLRRLCFADYERELPLVAVHRPGAPGEEIVAVGRLHREPGAMEAEFAVVVADAWQRRGLGSVLVDRLAAVARAGGCRRLTGTVLAENLEMQRLCARQGFHLRPGGAGEVAVERRLDAPG